MIQKFDNTNITIDKISQEYKNIEYYKEVVFNNTIGLIFLFLLVFSYLTYKKFIKELNSQSDLPQRFENIKGTCKQSAYAKACCIPAPILWLLSFASIIARGIFFL